MTREQLGQKVYAQCPLNYRASQEAVKAIFHQMRLAMVRGENIIIRRFGEFKTQRKRERMGRNPRTGEAAMVSARTIVKWKPGITLRRVVNGD